MSLYTISFDIDGLSGKNYKKDDTYYDEYFTAFGSIVKAKGFKHGIPSGIIELIQRLYTETMITQVICFSAGPALRNEEFWMALLRQSLCREKYRQLQGRVKIFSRQHLSIAIKEERAASHAQFHTWIYGEYRKKLQPLVGEVALKNTIHIDDDATVIFPGEEANALIAPVFSYEVTYKATSIEANQACYIAGMLFSCMKKAEKQSISLSEALFPMQFKKNIKQNTFKPIYSKSFKKKEIYLRGLEELKKVNAEFTFLNKCCVLGGEKNNLEKNRILIDTIAENKKLFISHWMASEYEEALKIIDIMLDSVERKSGKWRSSSKLVAAAVSELLIQVCKTKIDEQIALPLLLRIFDIPRDSKRDACITQYILALPQEIRSQYLMKITINYWQDARYSKAFIMLDKLLLACQIDNNFEFMETTIQSICHGLLPPHKKHYNQLLLLIEKLPKRCSDIQIICLRYSAELLPDNLKKIDLFFSLAEAYQKEGKKFEALQTFSDTMQIMHNFPIYTSDYDFIIASMKKAVGRSENDIRAAIAVIEKKFLKEEIKWIMLAHCYALLDAKKMISFCKLVIEAKNHCPAIHSYIIMIGLEMIEKILENRAVPNPKIFKFLRFLLKSYDNNRSTLAKKPYDDNDSKNIDFTFKNIRSFLCSSKHTIKKIEALATLSKIYCENDLCELSLAIIPEILNKTLTIEKKSNLVDSIILSLIFFQMHQLRFKENLQEIIEMHFSGICKEIALIFYHYPSRYTITSYSDGILLGKKFFAVVKAFTYWINDKKQKACDILKNIFNDKLVCFAVVEICKLRQDPWQLINIISNITDLDLKIYALQALQRECPTYDRKKQVDAELNRWKKYSKNRIALTHDS